MIILSIIITCSVIILFFWMLYRSREHYKNESYKEGLEFGRRITKSELESLRYHAVREGYAEWIVTDESTGANTFKWKSTKAKE